MFKPMEVKKAGNEKRIRADPSLRQRAVKGLGEVALRVKDLEVMQRFYQDVIGLELTKRFPHAAFFKIAEGYDGHTQVLALFDRSHEPGYQGVAAGTSTLDHFALNVSLTDFAVEKKRLEQLGLTVKTAEHSWVHWRSLYVRDPEGNRVEFVCYDEVCEESMNPGAATPMHNCAK